MKTRHSASREYGSRKTLRTNLLQTAMSSAITTTTTSRGKSTEGTGERELDAAEQGLCGCVGGCADCGSRVRSHVGDASVYDRVSLRLCGLTGTLVAAATTAALFVEDP